MVQKCPRCKRAYTVRMHDRGIKRLRRLLASNNRYYCEVCSVTWRAKNPNRIYKLKKRKKDVKQQLEKKPGTYTTAKFT
ncbi:hypothetical protein ACFL5V_04885 [Fibrobacterota bacterium]